MKPVNLSSEEVRRLVKSHYLFNTLEEHELDQVLSHARCHDLESGAALFHCGDPADRFFLVVQGQIKLYRLSPNGQERVVEIMGPGHTFAEAVMFMRRQDYPVSSQALIESRVIGLPNRDFLQALGTNPLACFQLLGDLSQRLHQRLNEIDILTLQNASYRVAHYLCGLLPGNATPELDIELTLPKQIIASRLSIQPETLSRVLQNLSSRGIATVTGRSIRVHDPERLRNYV